MLDIYTSKNRRITTLAALATFALTSCVNHINDEIQIGTTPITFSVKVQRNSTRIVDNNFESGDEAGLFATLSSQGIDQQRYIDNLRLVCDGSTTMIPEREIFYPEGENTLDIFSYYPYEKSGIEPGNSQLAVQIHTDQSDRSLFSASDFLTAEVSQISSSPDPIELSFKHRFAKIRLVLTPKEGESLSDLFKANPRIIASGFCTEAKYDFQTETFSELAKPADIIPYGEWEKDDNSLTGKEFIVIPQANTDGKQSFTMEWNGKIYVCPMPQLEMESDVVCEINIEAFQSTSYTLSGVVSSIKEWGSVQEGESTTDVNLSSVKIAALSFEPSKVYRVFHNSIAVAEVCKEYLLSPEHGLQTKALVAYPVRNEKTDLTQGTILQLLGTSESVHGGSIRWNEEGNIANYAPGNSLPISEFYIDEEDRICLTKPESPARINISSYTLRDVRKNEPQTYPIVKIGTQYWMGEDLRATQYRNGTPLEQIHQLGKAGYLIYEHEESKQKCYFYTGEALLAGEMAPYDWRIPKTSDWDQLKAYIGDNASLIKSGTWESPVNGNPTCSATNETDLNILAHGLYIFGKTKEPQKDNWTIKHYNWGTGAAYWISGEEACSLTDKAIMLLGNTNEVGTGGNHPKDHPEGDNSYAGLSIRCIKE